MLLQYYSALQSTTPVLLCPLLQHYKVPLQHYTEYCVLQSATPVLPCSATPVALLKWSEWERRPSAGAPGPRHSRRPFVMCKKQQPTVPEPGDNRTEPGLEPMTSHLRSGVWYHYTNCPLSPEWNMSSCLLVSSSALGLAGDTVLQREQLCTTKCCSSATVITAKCYASTTLLRCCSVLQSTAPALQKKASPALLRVPQSITPVLPCTAEDYSSATPYYKVLLKYYSVLYKALSQCCPVLQNVTPALQSTTPVLLCPTKCCSSTTRCHSSTTLYYRVLLQNYSVLQSAAPALLCTTKCYSNVSLHYKVRLQHYSFRCCSSATPNNCYSVPRCTTEYYSSTNVCYKVLLQYCWERRGAGVGDLWYKVPLQHHSE